MTVPTNATLSFRTKYDLEETWDFGFVQVSTDGGETYTSIACPGTTSLTDPAAHPTVKANVPGFTGARLDWTTVSCDLSAYAGQNVLLSFRFVTDWNTRGNDDDPANDGWWIDDVTLGGTVLSDGTSLAGWQSATQVNPVDVEGFTVQIVSYASDGSVAQLHRLPLDSAFDGTLTGADLAAAIAPTADVVAAIVTYDESTELVDDYAPYTLTVNGVVRPGGH